MVVTSHLALEYEEILKRHAAKLKLTFLEVDAYLDAVCLFADFVSLPPRLLPRLPDPDDEPILLAAEVSGARAIVTHNVRHFREAAAHGVSVLRPREFLGMVKSSL
jgi:predicted nucleic acid-binding protein